MHAHATPTILVVEDEALIRMNAAEMIQDAGWTALEAENSDEALQVLADHPEVDLLFTDINMPGKIDGLELASRVHETYPHVELVATSGKHIVIDDSMLPDDGTFLRKPYSLDDVTELIERKLGRSANSH